MSLEAPSYVAVEARGPGPVGDVGPTIEGDRTGEALLDRVAALEAVAGALLDGEADVTAHDRGVTLADELADSLQSLGFARAARLARDAARALSGDVAVESRELLRLSELIVALRWELAHRPAAGVVRPAREERRSVARASDAIVFISDSAEVRATLPGLLDPLGARVVLLRRPEQIRDAARDVLPSLLIVDLAHPDEDAVTACRQATDDLPNGRIPILVLVAPGDHDALALAFAAGADDCVRKPIVGPELTRRVEAYLERAHLPWAPPETGAPSRSPRRPRRRRSLRASCPWRGATAAR